MSAPPRRSASIRSRGQVLYEENSQDKRSIASITKVMTALVDLEDIPDLNTEITIERSDIVRRVDDVSQGPGLPQGRPGCCTSC